MLRLTGAHPFNAEAPLSLLYDSGFLTPTNLHFVRNHGAVPEATGDLLDWTISIEGMVEKPYAISLREIMLQFQQYTAPITLVCAGNRRKEQNMVKKSQGFNWGSAGISTSLWTGPLLWDIIERAQPMKRARWVCMEGGDKPANGAYGTCVRLNWVKDTERNIMLAYKQNGEMLTPDHGRPLRVVIPGVIGGRSVKWLKRIVISDDPSTNWYHFFDNRVLPTMVSPEMAKAEPEWWKDERYAIYDLNPQSVICQPHHNEVIDTSSESYTVKGFAYNGGGIRIGRIEISIDKGKSWKLASVNYPEDSIREKGYHDQYGGLVNVCDRMSCLCWCFWECEIAMSELRDAKDIVVRAMDERMVVQPRNMYWNVTAMLNNWWYRLALCGGPDSLRAEHPVLANTSGGWMDRVREYGGDIVDDNWGEVNDGETQTKPLVKKADDLDMMVNPANANKIISQRELQEHATDEHAWFVVKGHVFDGSAYLQDHPGGPQSITMAAGTDATEDFMAIHSEHAKKMLAKMHLGRLEDGGLLLKEEPLDNLESDVFLVNPKRWYSSKLVKKEAISHDSRVFSFALSHAKQTTGLPVGMHLFLRLRDKTSSLVARAYTPKSCKRTVGVLEVLIKVYHPTEGFEGGKMTMLMDSLSVGDEIEIKGPFGEFEYTGPGRALFNHIPFHVDRFIMVAGGSGITPCYQVIQEVAQDKEDGTEMTMFYANKTVQDILLWDELEEAAKTCQNLRIDYCLSQEPSSQWTGARGYLTEELLCGYVGDKTKSTMVLVCGPPGMVDVVKKWSESNYEPSRVVYF